jgi:hypothetical protein
VLARHPLHRAETLGVLIRRFRCPAASAAIHESRVVSRSANRGRAEPDRSRCRDRAMAGSFRETRPVSVSDKSRVRGHDRLVGARGSDELGRLVRVSAGDPAFRFTVGSSGRVRGSPTRLEARRYGERRASSSKSAGALGCGYDHLREPRSRPRWRPDLHGGGCRQRSLWPAGRMGRTRRPYLLNGGFA